jgi:drug/metabolite transporter (DMT)-like permease
MHEINKNMGAREWALLLSLVALWSCTFFLNAVALREIPILTLAWARVVIAAIALLAFMPMIGLTLPRGVAAWRALFMLGVLNNAIPFTLIVWAQSHIPSGLTSILNAATPLSTVVLCHFLTSDEKLTINRGLGVLIGFAGVVLLIGPQALAHVGSDVVAQLACLAAGVSYAFAGVLARRFRGMGIGPIQVSTGQLVCSSLLMLPFVLLVDQPWSIPNPSLEVWILLLLFGIFGTALGYIIFFKVLASAGATNILLVTFLNPIGAVLLGTLLLDEELRWEHPVAMLLIGIGLAVLDGRPIRALRGARA